MKKSIFFMLMLVLISGCESNRAVADVDCASFDKEGSVSFARPADYTIWFGSHSQRDLFEIVYRSFCRNAAGQPEVRLGIRYRGPNSWTNWFVSAQKHITISARCNFYASPGGQRSGGPILYSTNSRAVTIRLGETYDFKAVCPISQAQSYHVILGEE